ncbi:hypothetical protein HanRHA438_Chr05g0204041 [Helianthus annuus]|nr:hypothetical protein HanIR_Chr05g0209751 [Helianthus annuus]KAJ0917264.1 hypothetical protein HanRHA438_Chr05g0204041 [Helianthus annuus]
MMLMCVVSYALLVFRAGIVLDFEVVPTVLPWFDGLLTTGGGFVGTFAGGCLWFVCTFIYVL